MTEYRYTRNDRIEQLHALERSLGELIPVAEASPATVSLVPLYRHAQERTRALIGGSFNQADLSSLSRSIPGAFHRHKDWMPPLEESGDGRWQEPDWFRYLDAKLQPVLDIAAKLREIGYY